MAKKTLSIQAQDRSEHSHPEGSKNQPISTRKTVDDQPQPVRAALNRLGARLEQRTAEQSDVSHSAKVIKLPLWPEAVRGVPNVALRSALFGAVRRGPRKLLTRELITSVDGCEIRYTGGRLDQADLDVWEHCLHLARQDGVGCRIHFTAYSFLKSIQRATGGRNVEWLKNALARLSSAVVEIKHGTRAYFGPMIQHGGRDDATGQYCIEINPAIVALYGSDGWSRVDWEQRKRLKKQPLAQWLHGFYTSHAEPYAYKVETLHRLAGSEARNLFHFRAELKDALSNLAEVTGWVWQIDDRDLVHVEKSRATGEPKFEKQQQKNLQTQ